MKDLCLFLMLMIPFILVVLVFENIEKLPFSKFVLNMTNAEIWIMSVVIALLAGAYWLWLIRWYNLP